MCKYCEGHKPIIYTGENDNHIIDVGIFKGHLIAEVRYKNGMGTKSAIQSQKEITFCPMCGRNLPNGKDNRYRVSAEWIHPHKDSIGEYLDDLTYDQADVVRKLWQKDNIHKNVVFEKSELPFQGEGGNNGNKDTD